MSDSASASSATATTTATAGANDATTNVVANQQGGQANQQATDANQLQGQQLADQGQDKNTDLLGDLYAEQNNEVNDNVDNVVPENYQLNLNGQELSPEDASAFTQSFKELGLSNEKANQALNMLVNEYGDWQKEFEQSALSAQNEMRANWQKEVVNDTQLGGQNLGQTKQNISKAMAKYGTPELRQILNESGLGYNPQIVRFMNAIGASISNDNAFIGSNKGIERQETREEWAKRMYPNSPKLWK